MLRLVPLRPHPLLSPRLLVLFPLPFVPSQHLSVQFPRLPVLFVPLFRMRRHFQPLFLRRL